MADGKVIPVKVALRCRPLIPREIEESCGQCLQFFPEIHQIIIGNDKAFTYDSVFGPQTLQSDVYESSVKHLVEGIFNGYNATVLAYGQTGSGKTFTMGGGYGMSHPDADQEIVGVIPRVIADIFEGISERADEFDFVVRVSYMEIYKEDLLDLLVPISKREDNSVQIREDLNGGIMVQGLSERQVVSAEGLLRCLDEGSNSRTTGATAMNSSSSRSHAIFTIHVERCSKVDSQDLCKAKFHLVDLAGSERAKKTQAEGTRFKEGVNINRGLLALGNVISALGDDGGKRAHIPYRDSKLTRLLQDSLGGNSHTVMIACVSPADTNMEETLGTLRYADRARKIKNKPVVNRDPQAAEILRLKQVVQSLQVQLAQGGKGIISTTMQSQECSFDASLLKERFDALQDENKRLTLNLQAAIGESALNLEKAIAKEMALESLKQKVEKLKEKFNFNSVSRLDETYVKPEKEDESETVDNETVSDLHQTQLHPEEFCKEMETFFGDIDLSGEAAMLSVGEDGEVEETIPPTEHNVMMQRRVELNRDLADLNGRLESAEAYRKQLLQSSESWDSIKLKYEDNIKNLEHNIEKLQVEKVQMHKELHNKNNSAASKIAEARRQKLQQLEAQIGEMRFKIKDQSKMLKMKQQKEEQVNKLSNEIQLMKQQKVKMYKQLKEDNANFQKWKQAKDKEVMQLKAKERKHQAEMAKMERQSERQQTVLRRKAEEAAAANRRLKEALGRQKIAHEERNKKQETTEASGIGDRIRKWLSHDLDVAVSVEEVKRHKQQFLVDRKELTHQLQELRRQLEDELGPSASKRKALNDSSSKDVESKEIQTIRQEMKRYEREIELRTAQISDLQQKLLDVDQDEKTKSRFNSLRTMIEAKCGLRFLLNQTVEARVGMIEKQNEESGEKTSLEEFEKEIQKMKDEIHEERRAHSHELQALKGEHELETIALLDSLKNTSANADQAPNDALKKRLEMQEKEIERLSSLQDQLSAKSQECEALRQELTGVMFNRTRGCDDPLLPDILGPTPSASKPKRSADSPGFFNPVFNKDLQPQSDDEDDTTESDEDADPDYRMGYTPRSIYQLDRRADKAHTSRLTMDLDPNSADGSDSPSLISCACKTACHTKRCPCQKEGVKCTDACRKCMDLCRNREVQMPVSTTNDDDDVHQSRNLDSTFIMEPSVNDLTVQENAPPKRKSNRKGRSSTKMSNDGSLDDSGDTRGKKRKMFSQTDNFFTAP